MFGKRFVMVLRPIGTTLEVLTVISALMALVSMILYIGFDHTVSDYRYLLRMVRVAHGVFIANILYSLVFGRTINPGRRHTAMEWIVDILMLLTVLPVIYPHPDHPWIPWLEKLLYSHRFLFTAIGCYSVVQVSNAIMRLPGKHTNPTLMLAVSFLVFIFAGALILMLPRCTVGGISFIDSLFVATSAVSITGLTPVDIPATLTPMGTWVLGILIETGALGVITFTCFFATFYSGNSSIYSQLIVRDMIYSKSMRALFPTLLYVLVTTVVVQVIGAVALFFTIPGTLAMTVDDKIAFAAFHSVSAFCNAGFSTLPGGLSNTALMQSNQAIYWVFSAIIIAGAIGFPILVNFKDAWLQLFRRHNGPRRFHLIDMNSKIVLTTFFVLFALGALMFFLLERRGSMAGMTLWQQLSQSVFNSVTPRSAGFSSIAPSLFSAPTLLMVMFLMWVGGSAQSTAGGVKVNTLAAMMLNLRGIVTGRPRVTAFGRTISLGSIRRANATVAISLVAYIVLSLTLLILEPGLSPRKLLFEALSALFTVGSSLGVTESLSAASKSVLCAAMLLGRVGIISLASGLFHTNRVQPHYPSGNIIIN